MKMQKGAFMRGLDNMILKEIPVPKAGPGHVVVSLEYVGICGSDMHYYHSGVCGAFKVDLSEDYMLGHECAGTVVEIGEGVEDLKVGDRVALEPGITDGTCDFCKRGLYNLCPDVKFLATPPIPGCNEEYIEFPADYCFVLPENVSTMEGALIEPLSVGFHAANQGNVQVGDTCVVMGSGCIGLVTMLSCMAHGAGKVIVCDVIPAKLAKAAELGADHIVNCAEADAVKEVMRLTGGKGADVVFDATGAPSAIKQTAYMAAPGGTVVLVGISTQQEIDYDFSQIMAKELTIKSVFRYRNIFPKAIAAVASGAIKVKGIVTHEFSLEDIDAAYQEVVHNKTDLVKAVIRIKP